jgi:long-subunit acyl-CoA synthetase (AMP-forming)
MREFCHALCSHAEVHPDKIVFSHKEENLTFKQLLLRASQMAQRLEQYPKNVAILSENSISWPIAQIACVLAGKRLVPIPSFFNPMQIGHIINTSEISLLIVSEGCRELTRGVGLPTFEAEGNYEPRDLCIKDGFEQIIFTSGSTGQPKGVRLGSTQIQWSISALATASEARSSDRHLSLLPFPILLEALSAIFVPVYVGASSVFDCIEIEAMAQSKITSVKKLFEKHKPTTSVLVPQLLDVWTKELKATQKKAPTELRFVAVGGASTPNHIMETAKECGIPIFEGYGLSECCSVVCLNTRQGNKPETVGKSLPGLKLSIENGELIVEGPSVMQGYLGQADISGRWPTGDMATIDDDGYVKITGRKDNLIILESGRNISPEWIEELYQIIAQIDKCIVFDRKSCGLTVAISLNTMATQEYAADLRSAVVKKIGVISSEIPEYARPKTALFFEESKAKENNLFTANGRVNRKILKDFFDKNDDELTANSCVIFGGLNVL